MSRILVAGLPRSGTTWVRKVLALTDGAASVHEPDNEVRHPFAARAKRELGRFPVLSPGEPAKGFERSWKEAFEGRGPGPGARVARLRNRTMRFLLKDTSLADRQRAVSPAAGMSPRMRAAVALAAPAAAPRSLHVVVKSVHVPLALEWLVERYSPQVVLILRHPFDVLASWMELGLPDRDRRLDQDPVIRSRFVDRWGIPVPEPAAPDLRRAAWQFGLFAAALEEQMRRHPEWLVMAHEELCVDPRARFEWLSGRLGLTWTEAAEAYLAESNRPGTGFSTNRVASLEPERWRHRLNSDQVASIPEVLEPFELARWDLRADAARAVGR